MQFSPCMQNIIKNLQILYIINGKKDKYLLKYEQVYFVYIRKTGFLRLGHKFFPIKHLFYSYSISILNYIPNYSCVALEINGAHILNGGLRILRSRHFSAAGNDYDYFRNTASEEIVTTTGPLTNPLTVQVHTLIKMY